MTENTEVPGIDLNAPFIKIFVDDENSFHKVTPPGAVYDKKEKKIVISQDQLQNDEEKSEDRRTADVMTAKANTIDPSIAMSSEVPSDHPELGNRLPVLDTQVSIGSDGRILYKFYEKPMASPVLLQAEAMDERTKRANLTQEGVQKKLLMI